jgi:ribonuclease HI
MTKVWVDGSCINNGQVNAVGGWAVVFDDGRVISGSKRGTTNNEMELTAIIRALEETRDISEELVIVTDSQWAMYIITGKWKAKTHLDLVMYGRKLFSEANSQHLTEIEWVRGHSGDRNNSRADSVARREAESIIE